MVAQKYPGDQKRTNNIYACIKYKLLVKISPK